VDVWPHNSVIAATNRKQKMAYIATITAQFQDGAFKTFQNDVTDSMNEAIALCTAEWEIAAAKEELLETAGRLSGFEQEVGFVGWTVASIEG
jgi:hypothetical protein